MNLNKHALKQVIEFWAYVSFVFGYVYLVSFLTANYGVGWFIGGIIVPTFIGLSVLVYSQSSHLMKNQRKD